MWIWHTEFLSHPFAIKYLNNYLCSQSLQSQTHDEEEMSPGPYSYRPRMQIRSLDI